MPTPDNDEDKQENQNTEEKTIGPAQDSDRLAHWHRFYFYSETD